MGVMQTHSELLVDIKNPLPEQIDLTDIAHALSHLCRFGGHTKVFYSVADHSLNVTTLLESWNENRATIFAGLMHDACEAYIGDIVRPINELLPYYKELEKRFTDLIYKTFGIPVEEVNFEAIKRADETLMIWEARELFHYEPIGGWDKEYDIQEKKPEIIYTARPVDAKTRFIDKYIYLR